MRKNSLGLLISSILLTLLVIVGSYAYWTWNSDVNKNVVFNTSKDLEEYVVYEEGESSFVGNFQPTATFCEGLSTTFSVYKTEEIADVGLYATINMDINSIGTDIAVSDSVYWIVTAGDSSITCSGNLSESSVLNYGTFEGKTANSSFILYDNIVLTSTAQTFTVWIWVDNSGSDLSSLSVETIDTNIWTQINMLY